MKTIIAIFITAFLLLNPMVVLGNDRDSHSDEKDYVITVIVKDENNNAVQNASVVLIRSDSVVEFVSWNLLIKEEMMDKYKEGVAAPAVALISGTTDRGGIATLNARFGIYDLSIVEPTEDDSDYFPFPVLTWTKKEIEVYGDTTIDVTLIVVPSEDEPREVSESEYVQIITQIQDERDNLAIILNPALGDIAEGVITEEEMLTILNLLYPRFSDLVAQMKSIKPPNKYESFHEYRLIGIELTAEGISWLIKAIEEEYSKGITKGWTYIAVANEYENKATDELNKIRKGAITPPLKIEPIQVSDIEYRNRISQIENERNEIDDILSTSIDHWNEEVVTEEEMLRTLGLVYQRQSDLATHMDGVKPPDKYESFHKYKMISMELYLEYIYHFINGLNEQEQDYIDEGLKYKTIAGGYDGKALRKLVSTDIIVEIQSTTPTPTPIGFEVAIAGLLTVAYFLRRRK